MADLDTQSNTFSYRHRWIGRKTNILEDFSSLPANMSRVFCGELS